MRDLISSDSGFELSPSRVVTTQWQHQAATPGEERRVRKVELEPHQAGHLLQACKATLGMERQRLANYSIQKIKTTIFFSKSVIKRSIQSLK